MATKEEWVEYFKQTNGQQPSMTDFLAAKEQGFPVPEPNARIGPPSQIDWTKQFERIKGRKPTINEFLAAKENGEFAVRKSLSDLSMPLPEQQQIREVKDQTRPDQIRSDQIRSDQIRSDQIFLPAGPHPYWRWEQHRLCCT